MEQRPVTAIRRLPLGWLDGIGALVSAAVSLALLALFVVFGAKLVSVVLASAVSPLLPFPDAGEDRPLEKLIEAGTGLLFLWWAGFTLLVSILSVREVRADATGLTLRGRGRKDQRIALADILSVRPVNGFAMFLRRCLPPLSARLRCVSASSVGWYRLTTPGRTYYLIPASPAVLESLAAGIARPVPGRMAGVARGAKGAALALLAGGTHLFASVTCLGVVLPLAFFESDADWAEGAIATWAVLVREPMDRAQWTGLLQEALRAGNANAVRIVVVRGAQDGVFELDYGNDPCWTSPQYLRGGAEGRRGLDAPGVVFGVTGAVDERRLAAAARCAQGSKEVLPFAAYIARKDRLQLPKQWDWEGLLDARSPDLLRFAIGNGARLDQRDRFGRTPVMQALARVAALRDAFPVHFLREQNVAPPRERQSLDEAIAVAELLLQQGDSREVPDDAGRSVAYHALAAGLPALAGPLIRDTDLAKRTSAGSSLGHAAAGAADLSLFRVIAGTGPLSPGDRMLDGRTLLHFARGQAMVMYLLQQKFDVNARDRRGRTPLHHAALRGDLETARALVAHGALRQAADGTGRTPWDLVEEVATASRPARPATKPGSKPSARLTLFAAYDAALRDWESLLSATDAPIAAR